MTRTALAAALLLAALILPAGAAWSEERIELVGRPQVVQPVLYDAVPDPIANLILFPGGDGVLSQMSDALLMRVRKRLVAAGMSVAVPDTPADHPGGFGPLFRITADHAEDVAEIVDYFERRSPAPVWVIGHSNGTISAASAAVRLLPHSISGVILLSSVWLGGLADVPVNQITVPVLVIADRSDACPASPIALARQNMSRFTLASDKKFLEIDGPAHASEPCGADSPHDFYDADDKVVSAIVAFIKAHR